VKLEHFLLNRLRYAAITFLWSCLLVPFQAFVSVGVEVILPAVKRSRALCVLWNHVPI
jgi:hypothetical protein